MCSFSVTLVMRHLSLVTRGGGGSMLITGLDQHLVPMESSQWNISVNLRAMAAIACQGVRDTDTVVHSLRQDAWGQG